MKNPTPQLFLSITGDVTGVGYRVWAKREADRLGITGWVRNEARGVVMLQAQGPKEQLERFLALCRQGPDVSWVKTVEVSWSETEERQDGFTIR